MATQSRAYPNERNQPNHPRGGSAVAMLPRVYEELHALAERYLLRERRDHTLQPTALIHEAYLKLSGGKPVTCSDRSHFVGLAARAMRQILVNHAIRHNASKRGGDWRQVALDDAVAIFKQRSIDIIALNEALDELGAQDEIQARIVELRFFGGLSVPATAEVMGMAVRTVEREWNMARAWLRRRIGDR